MNKAIKERVSVSKENNPLEVNNNLCNISIHAIPLPNTIDSYYLVLFQEDNSIGNKPMFISHENKTSGKESSTDHVLRIQQLEEELHQLKDFG